MRITMLGTGHAAVTECYNTCFVLSEGDRHLLVDGGGGSGLVTQMAHAGFAWRDIHELYLTHKHIDHSLGMVWAVRMLSMEMRSGRYVGEAVIYTNAEAAHALRMLVGELLGERDNGNFGTRIRVVEVAAGQTCALLGHPTTFFDARSRDVCQLGFVMAYAPGKTLAFGGDTALREANFAQVKGATWLLHEAFCLSDAPEAGFIGQVGHSTVAEAATTAELVGAQNLLLLHTEDGDLAHRRERYAAEARRHFSGAAFVPDDLEVVEL